MSLKSYLDPVKAFDKWIIANPNGGIFVWKGIKLEVKLKNVLNCTLLVLGFCKYLINITN